MRSIKSNPMTLTDP